MTSGTEHEYIDPLLAITCAMMEKYPAEFAPEEHDLVSRWRREPIRINLPEGMDLIMEKAERLHSHEMGMLQ